MKMRLRTLKVLMWKHAVVRYRKYWYTIIELVAPLLLCLFYVLLKNEFYTDTTRKLEVPFLANTEILDLVKDTDGPPGNILYYPDTNFTSSIMDNAAENLDLNRIDHVPNRDNRGYYSYSNDSELAEYMKHMDIGDAIVIFQEGDQPFRKNKLNYTIRMKQNFEIQGYKPVDHGPHSMFGINYIRFMRIQWAVDTAFIKVRSGKTINQTLYLQEFPFYRRAEAELIKTYILVILFCSVASLLLPFVFFMTRLMEERTSGIQELMRMTGVSLKTIGLSHFLNVLPTMLVYSIVVPVLLTCCSSPFLPNTSGFILGLFFLLHFNSIMTMACACSYIINTAEYGVTIAVFAFCALWYPAADINLNCSAGTPYWGVLCTGFLPHMPAYWFWEQIKNHEIYGGKSDFKSMPPCAPSLLLAYLYLILQTILFGLIAWYLSIVRPGKYGQALPWNFFCKKRIKEDCKTSQVSPPISIIDSEVNKQFWTKKNEVRPDLDSALEPMQRDEQFFEKTHDNQKVGIRVEDVSKTYGANMVLKNVSLNVYQGEITVLLGHNGAGKTTLMNIITGMTSATEGRVFVNDLDTVTQQKEVRKHIGLCPQHNMFFTDLTLREHIKFFTLLKHGTFAEADDSSRKLAKQLGLGDKLNEMCANLSGGMKRRAQLACALAGNATVLVLDEPTSGLDVETRRDLWDLLLELRGSRTVLLSTHFMEEADALGDRVAALHSGVLRCFATTMYLKRAVGDGYRLTLTTIGIPQEANINAVVQRHVDAATLKEKTMNSVSYALPSSAHDKFTNLFTDLESKRTDLHIENIGLGVSTLEEVFMKLCSDVDTTVIDDEVEAITPDSKGERVTGLPLYLRQFRVLFKRQIKFSLYRKYLFIIMQIIVPLFILAVVIYGANMKTEKNNTRLRMNLDMYSDLSGREVLYNLNIDNSIKTKSFEDVNPGVTFRQTDNVAEHVARIAKDRTYEYNKYLLGIERINDTDAKILYTTTVRHAAPVALNLLTNLLTKQYLKSETSEISTYNDPVEGYVRAKKDNIDVKNPMELSMAIFLVIFLYQATLTHSASLPCRERETGSRHIHIMSGCPAELYWFTTLIFQVTITILFLIFPFILFVLLWERDNLLSATNFLVAFVMLLLVGALALLSFIYLTCLYMNERFTNILQIACLLVFGMIFVLILQSVGLMEDVTEHKVTVWWVTLLTSFWYFMPYTTLTTAALESTKLARLNAICEQVKSACPDLLVSEPGWNDAVEDRCCSGLTPKEYFTTDKNSPFIAMILLFFQFCFYMTMVLLSQRGIFNSATDWLFNRSYNPIKKSDPDPAVRDEKAYVKEEIKKPASDIQNDAILVSNVHKNYTSIVKRKSCNAVKGINFSVKRGECFGLLGVNGAGKSTAFKMLTDEECTTRGRIFGNGFHHKRGNHQYLRTLGYCPQFFGLDMFLTGSENLELVLTLRGNNKEDVKAEVESWIAVVGLEKYANRLAEKYSGGCQRRLGAASALCGGAPTALLDEPSAGVDVAARRRLWVALRKALRQRRSIIITSHSMDEMESMCGRIAIMCAGRVRALGSPAALRAAHAQGHAVVFKVKPPGRDEVDGATSPVNVLKGKLKDTFSCTLKDEHKTMLHYHINETMQYSSLFAQLEELKRQFPNLIEDYSVTETTLEEAFLALAHETKTQEV